MRLHSSQPLAGLPGRQAEALAWLRAKPRIHSKCKQRVILSLPPSPGGADTFDIGGDGEGGGAEVARVGIFNLVFHILGATRSLVCAERVAGGTRPRVAAGGFLPLPGTAAALLAQEPLTPQRPQRRPGTSHRGCPPPPPQGIPDSRPSHPTPPAPTKWPPRSEKHLEAGRKR